MPLEYDYVRCSGICILTNSSSFYYYHGKLTIMPSDWFGILGDRKKICLSKRVSNCRV